MYRQHFNVYFLIWVFITSQCFCGFLMEVLINPFKVEFKVFYFES